MNHELMLQKRHESRLQELRQERQLEDKRLDKLKSGLEMKLMAEKSKAREVRAA